MKAYLKNYRQAPRKVRLVAGLIKGKKIEEAIALLDFLAKRAGFPVKKLLMSAIANAVSSGFSKENLFVKEVRVDKGIVMKRMMPAAMGTGHRINKRTSHIALVLGEKISKETSKKGDVAPKKGKKPSKSKKVTVTEKAK